MSPSPSLSVQRALTLVASRYRVRSFPSLLSALDYFLPALRFRLLQPVENSPATISELRGLDVENEKGGRGRERTRGEVSWTLRRKGSERDRACGGGYIVHLPELEYADAASVAQEERRLVVPICAPPTTNLVADVASVKEDVKTDIGVNQGMGGVLAAIARVGAAAGVRVYEDVGVRRSGR
ncbi:hypothetical protein B0H13DRAFT_1887257 [Mycena leptocephala]|nr:hypothetical protein B0H13DRAFT_1887257 [Mycena leptocephala]